MNSFFCSWSGGKDSCLSLHKAKFNGGTPKFLLTTCSKEENRSRFHGIPLEILRAQSRSLGIPLFTIDTSWTEYRNKFIQGIHALRKQDDSITHGVFGDIDIEFNGQWERDVCRDAGIEAYLPLWKMKRKKILQEFFNLGFKAMIIAVDATKLERNYLGRLINETLIAEFATKNIDLCGENGEYHSVVFDGPIFKFPLNLKPGNIFMYSEYCFLDVKLN